jgi:hypothetical protein
MTIWLLISMSRFRRIDNMLECHASPHGKCSWYSVPDVLPNRLTVTWDRPREVS